MKSRAVSRPLVMALACARMLGDRLRRGRRAPPAAPRRILIAHHLLLGDTIMLTPLIAKCRARWPGAEIILTCAVPYADLYSRRPYDVQVIAYDPREPASLKPLLAQRGFDLALIPGDNRLSWLAKALDARWIVAFAGDRPAYKDWPVDELRPYPDSPMAWGDLVAGLVDGPPPATYRHADWNAPATAVFSLPQAPYAVLHVGASTSLKQWPAERWRQLGERLAAENYTVVLSAGPGEESIVADIDPERRWTHYSGSLSLPQLWHLLRGASVLVCPDTGIAHLGRVVGVPTVALFGPGSALLSGGGEFWGDSAFTALTIADFPCRDQRITMKREIAWIRRCERFPGDAPGECPEGRCMLALTEEMVWEATARHLGVAAH